MREIMQEVADGNVSWRAYDLADGRPTGDSFLCSRNHMARWATREATAEEVARLQRNIITPMEQEDREAILGIAEASLRVVSDAALLAEVRRRGLRAEEVILPGTCRETR